MTNPKLLKEDKLIIVFSFICNNRKDGRIEWIFAWATGWVIGLSELAKLTKDDLSIKLCDLLGIQVDFTKMTKEDLVKLYEELSKLLKPFSEMSLREIFSEAMGGENMSFTTHLRARVRKRLREITGEKEETKTAT